jgi:hypothetical protein
LHEKEHEMALDPDRLAAAIYDAQVAAFGIGVSSYEAIFRSMAEVVAAAVISELQDHGIVNPGSFAAGGDPVVGSGTVS